MSDARSEGETARPIPREPAGRPGRARLTTSTAGAAVALGCSLAMMSGDARADAIDTNRPGFSFTPGVVARGDWQLETGFSYTQLSRDADLSQLPLAEVRFGVADEIELFVSNLNWASVDVGGGSASGINDPAVGAKIGLGDVGRTRMAILLQLSVPIGDDAFSTGDWDPSAAFIWAHDGGLPLAGTFKVSRVGDSLQFDNGLKLLFAATDRRVAFVEWEANLPEQGGSAHWANAAFQWLLEDRIQLDASAGIGLNDGAGDYRFGFGFSYRR